MMAEDFDFEGGDAEASTTFPMKCSALRKKGYVMIKVNNSLNKKNTSFQTLKIFFIVRSLNFDTY